MVVDGVRIFFVVLLSGVAISALAQEDKIDFGFKCSTVCHRPWRSKSPVGSFDLDTTYIYDYKGKSRVELREESKPLSPPAISDFTFEAEVILSFAGHFKCDFTLQINNPIFNGVKGNKEIDELFQYPLMGAVFGGSISDVCAHPDDEAPGLNFKKGILSTIQNSLSQLVNIKNITMIEKDVVGICPTSYSLQESEHFLNVTKIKNHEDCTGTNSSSENRSDFPGRQPVSPLSLLTKSKSECYLTYSKENSRLTTAGCTDFKDLRFRRDRILQMTQTHTLTLRSVTDKELAPPLNETRRTDLIFEIFPEEVSVSKVPIVRDLLKKLCDEIQDPLKEEAAATLDEVTKALQSVPQKEIKKLLAEIKAGKICHNRKGLENLYLDAMAFVNNPGAVDVMVDQVVRGKVSGERSLLYTASLQFMKRPSIHSVKAVAPLFESKLTPSSMVLAAGSLVRKYCNVHENCSQEKEVQKILLKLSNKIDSTCSSSKKEKKLQILTVLKSIGNIGVTSKPLENSIWKCLTSKEPDTVVRVSAAQSFRQVPCEARPVEMLMKLTLEPKEDTEVRIASYVASITCANHEQAKLLLTKIEKESDIQVQSFILSHLRSLQRSDAPYLRRLRNALATLAIPPMNNDRNSPKLSKSVDLSYYLPTLGVGAGVESNVIYYPDSYIPRQIGTNLTLDLLDQVVNIGEFSLRTEDLDTILSAILGSEWLLNHSQQFEIIKKIATELKQKGPEIHKYLIKSGSKPEFNFLSNILEYMNIDKSKSKLPKIDAFARIFGQEISFVSLSPNANDFNADTILERILTFLERILTYSKNVKDSFPRGMQLRMSYFLPTAQGIPVQLKGVFIMVAALNKVEIKTPTSKGDMSPTISYYGNFFVGYNIGAKSGFRARLMATTRPNFNSSLKVTKKNLEFVLDVPPKKVKIIDAHLNCSMMIKMPGKHDVKVYPTQKYPVIVDDNCFRPYNTTNLLVCNHFKAPDYDKVDMSPLGEMEYSLTLSKEVKDKAILKILTNAKFEPTDKSFELKIIAPGRNDVDLAQIALEYRINSDTKSFLIFTQGPSNQGRSLLVNTKHRKSTSGSSRNIFVYYGSNKQVSSADHVLHVKMKQSKKGNQIRKEFYLETKKNFAKYVGTNIQVDVLTQPWRNTSKSSLEINKLELSLTVPEYFNTTHYIRKTPEANDDRLQYDIYSSWATPFEDLLEVTGNYSSEGEVSKLNRQSQLALSVNVDKMSYAFLSEHSWTHKVKKFHYSLVNSDTPKPMFLLEAAFSQMPSSDSYYGLYAQLECPSLIPTYTVDGAFIRKSLQDVELKMDLKEDGVVWIQGEGIVSYEKKAETFRERSEISLRNARHSQELLIKSRVTWEEDAKDAWITLASNGASIFSAKVEFVSQVDLSSTTVDVTIPKIVEANLKTEKTKTLLQMALSSNVQPDTEHSKKIKVSSYLNFINKEVKTRLSYDLDKDPNNKIEFRTRYDYVDKRKYASLKGELAVREETYKFGAQTMLGAYTENPNAENVLALKLVMPTGKEFVFDSKCLYIKKNSHRSTVHSIFVKTAAGDIHSLKSEYEYDLREFPKKMMIVGHTEIVCPLVDKIVIAIDLANDFNRLSQKGRYKMKIEGERISSPFLINLDFDNQYKELNAKALIDLGASSNIKISGESQIIKNNERKANDATMQLTLDIPEDKNYTVKAKKDDKSLVLELSLNGKIILDLEQASPKSGVWFAKITTPLRRAEAHSELTSDSMIFALYPNRIASEEKYEAEGHFIRTNSWLETGARLKYPSRTNDLRLQMNLAMTNETSQGTIEIDIFEKPQDKVVIDIKTENFTANDFRLEAAIKVPNQDAVPTIDVQVIQSREQKEFEIVLRKSANLEPKISYQMLITNPTFKTALVYSKLSTQLESIEMISEVKRHELLQCIGHTMNGTVVSTKHGSFDFKSALCEPAYLEFGAKDSREDRIYMTKVGMKRPTAVKAAVDLIFNSTLAINADNIWNFESTFNLYGKHKYLPKLPIALLGAKLWSSRFITLDATYNTTGLQEYFDTVIKPGYEGAQQLASDLTREIPEEIKEDIWLKLPKVAEELAEQINILAEELSREFFLVLKELGWTLPNLEKFINEIVNSFEKVVEALQGIVTKFDSLLDSVGLKMSFEKVVHIYHYLSKLSEETLIAAAKDIRDVIDAIIKGELSVGETPPAKWLSEKLDFDFWDWIKNKWHKLKDRFEHFFKSFFDFIHHYAQYFKDKIKSIYKKLLNLPVIKKFVDWIDSWFHHHDWEWFKERSLIGSLVSNYFWFSLRPESGLLRLQIPVKQPASSLSVAVRNVGISSFTCPNPTLKEIFTSSRNFFRFGAPASMGSGTLMTFKGRYILPLTFSECEILLAKVYGDKITAIIPDKRQTTLKIYLNAGTQVEIRMKESSPPETDLLKNMDSVRIPGMIMERINPKKIRVNLQGFVLNIEENEVEVTARPWALVQVQGLMKPIIKPSNDPPKDAKSKDKPKEGSSTALLTKDEARRVMMRYRVKLSCIIPQK